PAGVAVRECARAGGEELRRVRGHPAAAVDLLLVERAGASRRRVVAHRGERVAAERGERHPVRGGDTDRRRTADRERLDRDDELVDRATTQLDDLVRDTTLVEEDDRRAVLL